MIDIQNLNFGYNKQLKLFQRLDLALAPGSITGVLGKNGAGKTSLLKLICGLLTPQAGSITVLDHSPEMRQPSFLGRVFFVPEEFYLPSLSVKAFASANSRFYPMFDPDLFRRLLKEFELIGEHVIDRMSYGQKKKFLICFALASRCRLLVLDEPTNGLDIPSKAIFRKVLAGSLDEDQLILVSTHQVKDVETLVDRLVILDGGKVILKKDMHEIASELQFSTSHHLQDQGVLYSETFAGGYRSISLGEHGSSSVDIELLFNAVTKGTQIFQNHENK